MTLLDAALDAHAAGLAVIPVRPDGTKAPAVNWKAFQGERPTLDQLTTWFTPQPDPWDAAAPAKQAYDGLGFICGEISGHLEMLEIEGRATELVGQLASLMTDNGFGDLWTRICTGYLEQSPSGGMHWLYRVDGASRGNTKLARRPMTDEELAAHKAHEVEAAQRIENLGQRTERLRRIEQTTATSLPVVLIETRGEGGFTVAAPSAGRSHPTGKAWMLLAGGVHTIPTLSVDDRDALHAIANMLDAMPEVEEVARPTAAGARPETPGERPGDDYNAKATWDDILTPMGWQRTKHFGGTCYGWTRPGKNAHDGISATTGRNEADNLFVFTSSTEFDTEKAYSKFSAITLLEYGGDYAAAAKALRAKGYGTEASRPAPTLSLIQSSEGSQEQPPRPQSAQEATSGATVHPLRPAPAPGRTLVHTDDANALILVERHGNMLRHCSDRGRWYAWNGHVWAECPRTAGPAREYAKDVARGLSELDKKDVDHKKRSLSAVGVSAMLTQAASDPRVSVTYNQLDAHAWELNTPGGIVDLRTGTLGPSDQAKLHTRTTSCTPDSEADRSVWLQFLATTFGGDQELIDYLQRLVGYSAIGVVRAHVLPYCHGSGGNGKGVFLEACVKVLGNYATTAPAGFLMAKANPGHETEVARLAGARMVLCSEVNDEDRFDEARVKLLTGGDTLTARFMQQDHFTFDPTHQLWAMGNHEPHVRSGGRAFWRRLRKIPFQHEVRPEDIIDDLQGILAGEHGPAVLSWIVEGAVAYGRVGLQEPASVKAATEGYELDQDTVTRFLEEMCHVGGGEHVTIKMSIVRAAYESWCHESGDEPVSTKAFGLALRRHGIGTTRTKSAKMYVGLALIGDEEPVTESVTDGGSGDQGWYR